MLDIKRLSGFPFNLDQAAQYWVAATLDDLSLSEKIAQIMLPLARELDDEMVRGLVNKGIGGLHRFPMRSIAQLRRSAEVAQSAAKVPLLMTADLEMSEKGSLTAGTAFPNQMAVAATGDTENARRMAAIVASEGAACGFNMSWTPVVDLAVNRCSNVVNTRAFGSDADAVAAFSVAYLEANSDRSFAFTAKHWPGDGVDDRDQHFTVTRNSAELDTWRASFGAVFEKVIAAGVRTIMAGHISLPAYSAYLGDKASAPIWTPATLNADLTTRLLRDEMGYNGLIVSDATGMNGFGALGSRANTVPQCIAAGCDIILFPDDLDEDMDHVQKAIDDGRLSIERLDEAVARILIHKASLGLHMTKGALPAEGRVTEMLATKTHKTWARATSQQAITVVKDTQDLLPLTPNRHPRILLAELADREAPSGPLPSLIIGDLLRQKGFDVLRLEPGAPIDPNSFDVGLYAFGEEGVSAKENLTPQWKRMHGNFPHSMTRLWSIKPTVWLSLGSPFMLYHMPECRTFVNAYSAIPEVQRAAVDALCGARAPGRSPVDAFCGLGEAHL